MTVFFFLFYPPIHNTMLLLLLLLLLLLSAEISVGQLQVGFYASTCPDAEVIVSSVVRDGVLSSPNLPAILLRLHYHDCFVDGCDGSILIDNPFGTAEKKAVGHEGVSGFSTVETAKALLEQRCPGVVSCADILALMARDAIVLRGGPNYLVPTGRRDGLISDIRRAAFMPVVNDPVEVLIQKFNSKGLSHKDMVVLIAAHTIGTTSCLFVADRLYGPGRPDRTINPRNIPPMETMCPLHGASEGRCPLDPGSETRFDDHIFANIRDGFAVLRSDAALYYHPMTKRIIDQYLNDANGSSSSFERDFVDAILRLGTIGVYTGRVGQIRRRCSTFI